MTPLGFVIMYTRNVADKMAFYERAFGMQKAALADKAVYGEMLGGDVKLQFVQEDFARHYMPDFVPNRLERPAPESKSASSSMTSRPPTTARSTWDARPSQRPKSAHGDRRSLSCAMMKACSLR